MVFRLNMLRRDVEELKEKTWELDSTTRNNLGTLFYNVIPCFQKALCYPERSLAAKNTNLYSN
jgi:hypothetical protein